MSITQWFLVMIAALAITGCGVTTFAQEQAVLHPPVPVGKFAASRGESDPPRRLPPVNTPGTPLPTACVRLPAIRQADPDADPAPAAAPALRVIQAADAAPHAARRPWWEAAVTAKPLLNSPGGEAVLTVDQLVATTLANSPQLQLLRLEPQIERQSIGEAEGAFDWNLFVRNRWVDTNRPVGSTLDVGTAQVRLREQDLQTDFGVRRMAAAGGTVEASQVLQGMDSNSIFFDPARQGLTNLTLRFNQPLLRDSGALVTQGQIFIARHTSDASEEVSRERIADHLLEAVEAYWDVYRSRAELVVQRRLYESTAETLKQLKRRERLDAAKVMIVQAEATAYARQAAVVSAAADLQRAQNRLLRLAGTSTLDAAEELITPELPFSEPIDVSLEQALTTAVRQRPEVTAAFQRIKAAQISRDIEQNRLLPELSLILEQSLFGLRDQYNIGRAWVDQFSQGRPTWTAGLHFEYPLENRAAQARYRRAALEAAREVAALADAVQQIRLEVKNAMIDLQAAHDQLVMRRSAMDKAADELERLERRRQLYPETDRVAFLFLQELLESQQRRSQSEQAYIQTQVAYAVAILRLRRAEGSLWQETAAQLPDTASTP